MRVVRWTTGCGPRVAAVLVVCSALAAMQAGAHAAAPTLVSLEYEIAPGIDGCPDAEQFRSSVGRQLGYDPFRATAEKRVAVQIARKEIGFDGRIRWSDAEGHWVGDRRLSSRHAECTEIAASLAFSVAVQIQLLTALAPAPVADPNAAPAEDATKATTAPTGPREEALVPEQRPTEAAPVEVAVPAPPPEPSSGFRLSIGAGPSLAISVAPHAAGLGRLFASGRVGHFSLEIAGDAALPVTQTDAGGRGFRLDRFAAAAAACGHVSLLAACVTGTAGRLQAHGLGVDMQESPAAWFSQLGARIAATYDFSDRYFAAARVDGLVMTAPVKVMLNDTLIWTTPRVGAVLGIDFGARFF